MIHLRAHDLRWINGQADDPGDRCAHSEVEFAIDGSTILRPQDGVWTVSAAALFLLRTLTDDHTPEARVAEGNALFPCCGFNVWRGGGRYPVLCVGCPRGFEVDVRHVGDAVEVRWREAVHTVSIGAWRDAVLGFAAQVEALYARSAPKPPSDHPDDAAGWEAFWQEWRERARGCGDPERPRV